MTQDCEPAAPPEPRWPALVAMLCVAGLYAALPASLAVGPRWLLVSIIGALEVPVFVTHRRGMERSHRALGHLISGIVTGFMVWSLALLVMALLEHRGSPLLILRSAGALWWTNVLVFALWYWRLDAGGPNVRGRRPGHSHGDFLFPQMTLEPAMKAQLCAEEWSPNFWDYLFLAFNTSTALSPADTAALSRWAKVLMMVQASISLNVIVLLAARAVNIL